MTQTPPPSQSIVATEPMGPLLRDEHFAATVWEALAADPLTGVQLVTPHGEVLYANVQAALMFFGPRAQLEAFVGRNVREWFTSPEALQERLGIVADVAATGSRRQYRNIYHGRQVVSTLYRVFVGAPASRSPAVLIVTRYVHGDAEQARVSGVHMEESRDINLGPLDILSPRELEVLALIGEGLSLPEIAAALSRSPHTIHDHRKAIGRKLGVDDRVRLAELAKAAGLRPTDAALKRMQWGPDRTRPISAG